MSGFTAEYDGEGNLVNRTTREQELDDIFSRDGSFGFGSGYEEVKMSAMRAELLKIAFTVSQYSGPLSYGPFPMESSLPDPGSAGNLQAGLTARTAKRMRGEPVEKLADVSPASSWDGGINSGGRQESSLPDSSSAGAMQAELTRRVAKQLEKRGYSAQTPGGRLAQTRSVGAPKMSEPEGPSISTIAKPKGPKFGRPIPGAKKGTI